MTIETARSELLIVPPHRGVWIPARLEHQIRMSGSVSMRTLYFARSAVPDAEPHTRVVAIPPFLRELVLRVVDLGHTAKYIPHGGIYSQ